VRRFGVLETARAREFRIFWGDWNLQDWKLTDNIAGVEIAGLEIEGLEIDGLEFGGLEFDGLKNVNQMLQRSGSAMTSQIT